MDPIKEANQGLTAYQLTMGQAPEEADIVEIFVCGPDVCVATVVDQKKYYQHWLDSVAA